jgi:hypothetical protein
MFMRDPFSVIPGLNLLNQGMDQNTRVIAFLSNLQLAPNDVWLRILAFWSWRDLRRRIFLIL